MGKSKMTRYAFIEHMKDYMKELLNQPLKADTDYFLHGFGIDAPSALKMLLKKTDPNDEYSAIVIRTERIKDNGYDENGKRSKDTFEIKYRIPRKDFKKKLRNLYTNLFEQNLIARTLEEGAWGYDILQNDSALDLQSEFAGISLNVLCSNVSNSMYSYDFQNLWAHVGVLVDFLKKYKDDEIQLSDKYTYAIKLVKNAVRLLYHNEEFVSSWDEPRKIKSSLKKVLKDVSLLQYQDDIMNTQAEMPTPEQTPIAQRRINEEGEGGSVGGSIGGDTMPGMDGASTTFTTGDYKYDTSFKKKNNESDVIRKTGSKQIYVTEDQVKYIKEATTTNNAGNYQYDVPFAGDDETLNHKNILKTTFNYDE